MIADLDETLRQLLIAELPIKNGEIEISFDQPKREWSARLSKPTVNLFLYDLRENAALRAHQWERMPGNGGNGQASMKRTPYRVDCFYMLTTWAAEPEDEHRLLTRSLMALFRYPLLPEDRLVGSLKNPAYEIQASLARHDRLTNPAEVWSSLDNEMRPSVSYLITLALDPWKEISGPIVRTFSMRTGQARPLPRYRDFVLGGIDVEMLYIGGMVRSKKSAEPQQGLQVAIKGTGIFGTTDEQGQYTLGALLPGDYILVVWSQEGKPKEKKISVPAKDGDYDLEIG